MTDIGFRSNLTDVDKAILFHNHEANRCRFFGMMKQEEYHIWMAGNIQRMQEYSKSTAPQYTTMLQGKKS